MLYTSSIFDIGFENNYREKDEALDKVFNNLIKLGEKNIILIHSQGWIGIDHEATVDGGHFSDLGFMRFAEHLLPIIDYYGN